MKMKLRKILLNAEWQIGMCDVYTRSNEEKLYHNPQQNEK